MRRRGGGSRLSASARQRASAGSTWRPIKPPLSGKAKSSRALEFHLEDTPPSCAGVLRLPGAGGEADRVPGGRLGGVQMASLFHVKQVVHNALSVL